MVYRFKEARLALKMTQDQVAAKLGISRAAYTNIELGKRDPDTASIIQLAKIFDVTTDFLLGLSDTAVVNSHHDVIEIELLEIFKQLNSTGKDAVMTNARAMLSLPAMREEGSTSSMG